jgi:predicted ABC-type ATPase
LPSRKTAAHELRLRIFAGPNGSGKSTIIHSVRTTKVNGKPIDFGYYINADDITQALKRKNFSFSPFRLRVTSQKIIEFANQSGLLNQEFNVEIFERGFLLRNNSIVLKPGIDHEKMGQILARFLREEMLRLKRRFSFETVFSHESNLDIMRRAKETGYKVYLYFVSTESPEINKYRVSLRVAENGHNVPPDTIERRYYRSLSLMFKAAQLAYQAFFFDNSKENEPFELVAHFKMNGQRKNWDKIKKSKISGWYKKYYSTQFA